MRRNNLHRLATSAIVVGVTVLLGASMAARAEDPDASFVDAVTAINGMVEHGVVSREAGDAMIRDAEKRAAIASALRSHGQPVAATAGAAGGASREEIKRELLTEMKGQLVQEIKQQLLAELSGGGLAAPGNSVEGAGKGKSRSLRVPYVPESVRQDIHDQLKKEVLAQAKEEKWGNPGALPDWLEHFKFDGDIRLRYDAFRFDTANTPAGITNYVSGNGLTRAADIVGANGNFSGVPNAGSQENFSRTRLRARLGATISLSDSASAGVRIATGSTSGPTSTNQTMGQGFNKYSIELDRGYITLDPASWLSFSGGRIANPFFSTDLVWADDLNFEGGVARVSSKLSPEFKASLTAGWFPLRNNNPLQSSPRNLTAIQAGLDWTPVPTIGLKLGVAGYDYHGIQGQLESNARYGPPSASDYGTRYEYPSTMRQRGNTLFAVNAPADALTGTTYWGLASGFRELDLTASLDISSFDPLHVVLTGDFVKNLSFDRKSIAKLTGSTVLDGRSNGYLGRILVGEPALLHSGDWNVSLTYRWLGSDAVLDAFTNSDFGMGGTNNKGYIFGAGYGIDKNTWLAARWMSSDLIDSYAPKVAGSSAAPTKFTVDLLQIDLNSKF